MKLSDTFECKKMGCNGFTYNACLIRQQSILSDRGYLKATPRYAECQSCEQGIKNHTMFPDWKYQRNTKRKKPDRINLRKDKRKKKVESRGCPYPIKNDNGTAKDCITKGHCACNEADKPFNAKLFVKAQKGYIKALMMQGKTVEVRERIDLVNSELAKRGMNYENV